MTEFSPTPCVLMETETALAILFFFLSFESKLSLISLIMLITVD